jgi:hypothetical protein
MALKLSTGLRDSLLGNAYLKGTSMAYVDGAAGNDYITDSENRFLKAGFKVGDLFSTTGSTTANNDLTNEPILAVAAGKLEFATGQVHTAEAFVAATDITGDNQGSLQELFKDGIIHVYSGSQPADANAAETGTKLLEITVSSGAFVPGSADNGLEIAAPSEGKIGIKSGETWSGVGIAEGTAGWFRFYDNLEHEGAVSSAVRLDGNCATSGAQLNMSSTSVAEGATTTIDSFDVTMPAS